MHIFQDSFQQWSTVLHWAPQYEISNCIHFFRCGVFIEQKWQQIILDYIIPDTQTPVPSTESVEREEVWRTVKLKSSTVCSPHDLLIIRSRGFTVIQGRTLYAVREPLSAGLASTVTRLNGILQV